MRTIHHVDDIPAPIQAIWEALSTEQGLSGWWSSQVEVSAMETGGKISFRFQPGFKPIMQITDLEKPHRIGGFLPPEPL